MRGKPDPLTPVTHTLHRPLARYLRDALDAYGVVDISAAVNDALCSTDKHMVDITLERHLWHDVDAALFEFGRYQ